MIYVDDAFIPASVPNGARTVTSRWCHLFTDQDDQTELHKLARKIGLQRSWFQDKKHPNAPWMWHYDVTEGRRRAAVRAGAVEISWRESGRITRERRLAAQEAAQ